MTKLLSVIVTPVPLLHSFDRAEWHSTYIQWLSKKSLHQRKKCAHEPRLDSPGPPSRDLRTSSGCPPADPGLPTPTSSIETGLA